jgi:hypothetical protein
MGRRRHQVSSPISSLRFRQLTEHDGAQEHTVALDQRQVGRDDRLGGRQDLSNVGT